MAMATTYFTCPKVDISSNAGVRQPDKNQDGAFQNGNIHPRKFNQVFFTCSFSFINHITRTPTDFKQSLLLAKIHIQN